MYELKDSTGTVFVQLQHVFKVLQQSKQVGHAWFFCQNVISLYKRSLNVH